MSSEKEIAAVEQAPKTSSRVVNVKFKRLVDNAEMPVKGSEGAAGFDLTVTSVEHCYLSGQYKYGFGIAVEIPEGYTGFLFPRSSVKDTNLRLTNSVGVIDSDYRGELKAVFATGTKSYDNEYKVGDRAVQLVIMRTPSIEFTEADELSETNRGDGGYGSTGR